MSLSVMVKSRCDGKESTHEFHVPLDRVTLPAFPQAEVDCIRASGKELGEVLATFPNLPVVTKPNPLGKGPRVFRGAMAWYGDMARFIYHNLRGGDEIRNTNH